MTHAPKIVLGLVLLTVAALATVGCSKSGAPQPPAAKSGEAMATDSTPQADVAAEPGAEPAAPNLGTFTATDADFTADAAAGQKTAGGKVMLGSPELTAGIPGEGPLKKEDIEKWLSDPRNHEQLDFELPLGLAAGASQIQGVDKNPLTRAKIELGRQLYFDPRLSVDSTVSCAISAALPGSSSTAIQATTRASALVPASRSTTTTAPPAPASATIERTAPVRSR